MTRTEPQRAHRRPTDGEPPVGGFPRIDLLPVEVKLASRLRATQSVLLLLLVPLLAAVAAALYWAALQVTAASDRLASEQAITSELLLQQQEYAELPAVTSLLSAAEGARQAALSTDVDWASVLTDFESTLPPSAEISSLTVSIGSPTAPYVGGPVLIGTPSVGSLQYVVSFATEEQASRWMQTIAHRPSPHSGDTFSSVVSVDSGGVQVTGEYFFDEAIYWSRYPLAGAIATDDAEEGEQR